MFCRLSSLLLSFCLLLTSLSLPVSPLSPLFRLYSFNLLSLLLFSTLSFVFSLLCFYTFYSSTSLSFSPTLCSTQERYVRWLHDFWVAPGDGESASNPNEHDAASDARAWHVTPRLLAMQAERAAQGHEARRRPPSGIRPRPFSNTGPLRQQPRSSMVRLCYARTHWVAIGMNDGFRFALSVLLIS